MISDDDIVYLDNNATTQLDAAVVEEMMPFLTKFYGNPSGGYQFGTQVRSAIDLARKRVAALIGAEPAEIVFTSCGTEANNAAINSAVQLDPARRHIVTTAVEHSAVLQHCEALEKNGCAVTYLGVDAQGNVDLAEVERAIRPDTAIVSVMWANNETGVIFPVEEIAQIARAKRVLFHTDAVQAVGKIPIRLGESAINFLSLSAHKLHGPKGVGALYVNKRARFHPSQIGGGQENGRRAGTENVASIVALGKAAECATAAIEEENDRVRNMRDRFEKAVCEKIPDVSINGNVDTRLPNTSNLSFAGVESDAALILLDRHKVCCSAGSACRTGLKQASHVLRAMDLPEERLRGALRFSFGRFNSEAQVDHAMEVVVQAIGKLRRLSGAHPKAASAA
ncbi:MAG: cysteine desulfurase [Verrucomicrobiota bacterium]